MNEHEIMNLALENLQRNTQIEGQWAIVDKKEPNGTLILDIENQHIKRYIKISKELPPYHLQQVFTISKEYSPLMIVATRLPVKIKEELRKMNIDYLEANGNIYLKNGPTLLWIDNNKPLATEKKPGNRAFTKTGLKVVFQFLLNENWLNRTYREISRLTETGIGNITNIVHGLRQDGFLLPVTKNEYKMTNKQALLHKWIAMYELRLKPGLIVGTFRFLKSEDFNNWKNLPLDKNKTWWGGEPAGDLLTNYLRPAELTLYTIETRNDLIKNYRLIPVENGNIKIYKKFWQDDDSNYRMNENIVPPILVYADLLNKNDRRCTETAQKIYDEFLQNKL